MAEIIILDAQPRARAGKGAARATRREGLVPGVIYGDKKEPLLVAVDPRSLVREVKTGGLYLRQFSLRLNGEEHRVMARDLQLDPVTDAPVHVDFLRVTGQTRVTVDIPVVFVNEEECPGLTRGGVLNIVRHEVEVHAMVDNIPEHFVFDLSGLEIGDSVHISMTEMPTGVEPVISDRDFTIATIAAPTVVAEEAAAEEEAAEEAVERPAEEEEAPEAGGEPEEES